MKKMLIPNGTFIRAIRSLTVSRRRILQPTRLLSAIPQRKIRNQNDLKFLPDKDLQDYISYLPKFIEDVTDKEVMLGYPLVNQRIRNVLEYMGPTGKHLRQHLIIYTCKAIEEHYQTFAPQNMEEIHKLCWCLEMLNKAYTIYDDYLDDHDTRNNLPTWINKVGKLAIMDMQLLQASLRGILKRYFKHHPRFNEIYDLIFRPEVLVSMCLVLETKNYKEFTLKRCEEIAMMKTTFYVCDQPFMLSTLFCNKGLNMNEYALRSLRYLGLLYSMQNDILDVYGTEITGKACADIKNNECTYVIAMAFEKASIKQKKILMEHYGRQDQMSIGKVKEIYDELNILGEYYKLEERYLEKSSEEIRRIPDEFTRSLIARLAYVQSYGEIGIPPY